MALHPALAAAARAVEEASAHFQAREVVEALVAAVERHEQLREQATLRAHIHALEDQLAGARTRVRELERDRLHVASQAAALRRHVLDELATVERHVAEGHRAKAEAARLRAELERKAKRVKDLTAQLLQHRASATSPARPRVKNPHLMLATMPSPLLHRVRDIVALSLTSKILYRRVDDLFPRQPAPRPAGPTVDGAGPLGIGGAVAASARHASPSAAAARQFRTARSVSMHEGALMNAMQAQLPVPHPDVGAAPPSGAAEDGAEAPSGAGRPRSQSGMLSFAQLRWVGEARSAAPAPAPPPAPHTGPAGDASASPLPHASPPAGLGPPHSSLGKPQMREVLAMKQRLDSALIELVQAREAKEELEDKCHGLEGAKAGLGQEVKRLTEQLELTARQSSADREVLGYLDSRVRELEALVEVGRAHNRSLEDEAARQRREAALRVHALSEALESERAQRESLEQDMKLTKSVLVKEVKALRRLLAQHGIDPSKGD